MSDWSVYVLRCCDGSFYTGVTNDLSRRLDAHRAGTASKYTRSRLPVRLMCVMGAWPTRSPALKLEARIKTMTRVLKQVLIATVMRLAASIRPRSPRRRPAARRR